MDQASYLGVRHDVLSHNLSCFKVNVSHEAEFPITPADSPLLYLMPRAVPPLLSAPSVDYEKLEVRVLAVSQVLLLPNIRNHCNHSIPL